MKTLIISISIILLLSGCEHETDDNTDSLGQLYYDNYDFQSISYERIGNGTKVLIMGDSTMYGGQTWDLLPYNIYNVAKPGTTTRGVINRLHFIDSLNPDYVVIGVGINDARLLTFGEFNDHITSVIDYCNDRGVPVVFIEISDPYYLTRGQATYFNNFMSFVSDNYLIWNCTGSETPDGIHFNSTGYTRLSGEIELMIDSI